MARLMDLPGKKGYEFKYRNAASTNLAETFRRARAALEAEAKEDLAKVTQIKRQAKK